MSDESDPSASASLASEVKKQPELRVNTVDPKGVLQKNLKTLLFLGVVGLMAAAAFLSSTAPKKVVGQQPAGKGQPPQPMMTDNTASNVQAFQEQFQAEHRQEQEQERQAAAAAANRNAGGNNGGYPSYPLTPEQQAALYGSNGCPSGQPCDAQLAPQSRGALTPVQEQDQQLAAKERERLNDARFASNIAYKYSPGPLAIPAKPQTGPDGVPAQDFGPTPARLGEPVSNLIPPEAAPAQEAAQKPDPPQQQAQAQPGQAQPRPGRKPEVNLDSATGPAYVLFEGTTLDTVLMNRLDGDAVGPVKVLVSNPVYSHDRQHVLIPEGTVVLGEARKIGETGFGQQRRIAVVFHRLLMPDGYSVDLDQFHGLNQVGEEGLKDKVDNHYLQIFGTSIALGVIAGAAQIQQGGSVFSGNGAQVYTSGAAASLSQNATTVLDRFIQIPPTITIREGQRLKVYFTQDMLLPAYTNHTISQSY